MKDLIRYFLYLGLTGFGGPLVLVQMMRQHFVKNQNKITEAEFDQTFALVKAMPGPVAFQMATFIGQKFYGVRGGFFAGAALLLPAFIMMIAAGVFYETLTHYDAVNAAMSGLLFAASAVILFSLKSLIISNQKRLIFWFFMVINLYLMWFHILPEPVLIILFGILAVIFEKYKGVSSPLLSVGFFYFDLDKIIQLFKTCSYAGAFVFGTGFALIPVLKTELVDVHQLISLRQFNDGVIFGQMTPGPITITTSFLGYQISGLWGALVATIGVFLFPFIHMVTWFPRAIRWMSAQKWISTFVMGATSAVVAGILVTLVQMNDQSYKNPGFWIIFGATSACLYFKPKLSVFMIFVIAGFVQIGFKMIGLA